MDKERRLVNPSQGIVDRLATEEHVIEKDVRAFSEQLAGLTVDEGIVLLDDLRDRRSWNMPTYMAAVEVLDAARQQPGDKGEVVVQDFDRKIESIVNDIRKGCEDAAAVTMQGVLVERLTQEVRETLGTFAETSEEEHIDDLFDELTMELVIAHADRTQLGVRAVTETVDRFMETHVRPLRATIIADVVSNLNSGAGARGTSRADNDA